MKESKVKEISYDRSRIKAGIVHIGVGNFHRAHQEYYTHLLLSDADQQGWGVCGIGLRPTDKPLHEALKEQDCKYSLTICDRDGSRQVLWIGSLLDFVLGMDNPELAIDKIADPLTKIVTLTITEGGYNLDPESGEFRVDDELIKNDLKDPKSPKTAFGFVAEALRKRMKNGVGGLTILSCDNLQHNGTTAEKAFRSFFKLQDKELSRWAEKNVSFPNSMVDRITPSVSQEDIARLNKENGLEDLAPVYCEDFTQWVVEDDFVAGRPSWERVGVKLTKDVAPYENMKLSLLNASHTMLSYPAFLMGYRKVDQAIKDPEVAKYIQDFMDIDVTPYVPTPEGENLDEYKKTLMERFSNSSVGDQLARICYDGISKIPVYIVPNLIKMIKDGHNIDRLAFFVAVYRYYLKYQKDDEGNKFEINEPWLSDVDKKKIASSNAEDFLDITPLNSAKLKGADTFILSYMSSVKSLEEKGVRETLIKIA
ncbi:mannitol dehydrogenase family protein [Bacteroides propionicifaciens]|uniref:mannitol dehydrogenase family protein n=1 Tax=Bacteroides propionicifaciens TaxID=392838 RepID=UPI0003719CBE|nr:mannitol dehydrogenase family protein [Bacteroides propionicifaciens]